jgi:hypothetical protein
MSQENVERLRAQLEEWDPKAQIEAWKRGEKTGLLSRKPLGGLCSAGGATLDPPLACGSRR